MAHLRLSDVVRTFVGEKPVTVLKGISLTIAEGEFTAIEGASGAGKSTLLNIIGALDAPTSGSYTVDGRETVLVSDRALSRIRSGTFAFVFQSFHLLDRRRAVESVELGLLYRGVSAKERRARALEAMNALGIGALAHTRSSNLSGGERQRVALARALACQAPVIIADEPTGNLDSENAKVVVQSLLELNERGTTIVLVTHSPEVAGVASRRIRMADGILVSTSLHEGLEGRPHGGHTLDRADDRRPGSPSHLRVRDLLQDAAANIASRGGKTVGLVAAVALAVALTVGSLGVAGSARSQVSARFDEHSNRDVTLEWPSAALDDQPPEMRASMPDRLAAIAGVDNAAIIENHGQTGVQAGASRVVRQVTGFSGSRDSTVAARLTVKWANGAEHRVAGSQALLGTTFARQLELAPLSLSPVILVNG